MVCDSRFQSDQPRLISHTGSYGGGAPNIFRSFDKRTEVFRS